MSKRPNLGLSNTAMAGAFALQPSIDNRFTSSKPFDGFKTSTAASKKPFDLSGNKGQPNTEYGSGAIGYAAKERALAKDIMDLDWELDAIAKKPAMQSEVNLKPKLFIMKKGFNDTGETKTTAGTTGFGDGDWDLGDWPSTKKPVTKATIPAIKEKTVEVSEWHLDKFESKPKSKLNPMKK